MSRKTKATHEETLSRRTAEEQRRIANGIIKTGKSKHRAEVPLDMKSGVFSRYGFLLPPSGLVVIRRRR